MAKSSAKRKPALATKPTPEPSASWKQAQSTYIVGRSCLDGVDAMARDMEAKWGVGRLRLLVDAELRGRFDSQRAKLNRAIESGELEDVRRESARMENAWRALDAAAVAAGASPLAPQVWEVALPNGQVAALVREAAEARAVRSEGRYLSIYTLNEIANLIVGFPEIVKAKDVFPGAEIVRVGPITDPLQSGDFDDAIPF